MSDSEHDLSKYKEDELDLLETLTKPGSTYAKKNETKAKRRLNRIMREKFLRAEAKKDTQLARARAIAEKTDDIRHLPYEQQKLVAKHVDTLFPTAKEAVEWLRKVTPGSTGENGQNDDAVISAIVKHHPEDLVRWARNHPENVYEAPKLASITANLENTIPFVSIRWTDGGHDDDEGEEVLLKYRERLGRDDAFRLALNVLGQEPLGRLDLVMLMRRTQRVVRVGDSMDMLGRHLVFRHYDGEYVLDVRIPMKETTVSLPAEGKYARLVNCDECWECLDGFSLKCEECEGHYQACRSFDAIGFMLINGFAHTSSPEEFVAMYGVRYNADRVARGLKPIDLEKHAKLHAIDSRSGSDDEEDDEDD